MISVSDDTRASLVDYAADGGELVADPELSDGEPGEGGGASADDSGHSRIPEGIGAIQ